MGEEPETPPIQEESQEDLAQAEEGAEAEATEEKDEAAELAEEGKEAVEEDSEAADDTEAPIPDDDEEDEENTEELSPEHEETQKSLEKPYVSDISPEEIAALTAPADADNGDEPPAVEKNDSSGSQQTGRCRKRCFGD